MLLLKRMCKSFKDYDLSFSIEKGANPSLTTPPTYSAPNAFNTSHGVRAFLEKYPNASFGKINHLVVTTKESYYSFHGADLLFDSIWPKLVELHSWIFQFMEALSTQGGYHLFLQECF